jgi:hypothetical protein
MSAILTSLPLTVKADGEDRQLRETGDMKRRRDVIRHPILSLTGFEPLLCLVDDVDTSTTANDAVIAMPRLERLEGILDLHDHTCFVRSSPGKMSSGAAPVT